MKKILLFLYLMLVAVPFHVNGEELPERVMISFHDQIDFSLLEEKTIEVHHLFEGLKAVSVTISSSVKQELLNMDSIKHIEKDSMVQAGSQVSNWGYNQLNIKDSHEIGLTGKGVKIGILDTGIDINHPDLEVAGGKSFISGQTSFDDQQGHGTHVAGIIAALDNDYGVVGVAPESDIYALKVLDNQGEGNLSNVIAGIDWAIEQELDIINLSLSSEKHSYLLMKALERAYDEGILIIAASGNIFGIMLSDDVLYPSKYPSTIAVGSINENYQRSDFSYYGANLEFVAPGEGILSSYAPEEAYSYMSGTSMATAFATGIAALYKQSYPDLSNEEIREMMQQNAIDLGEKGKDFEYGYGLIHLPSEQPFYFDISSTQWYTDAVKHLSKDGVVTGYPNGYFHPEKFITRAEAVTMIGRVFDFSDAPARTTFPDVPMEHFASGYIRDAVNERMIGGYPDQTFKPNQYISRGDVAVILQRAFELPLGGGSFYKDVPSWKYYANAVNSLSYAEISKGYPDGTFRPEMNITRAEFSLLLHTAMPNV